MTEGWGKSSPNLVSRAKCLLGSWVSAAATCNVQNRGVRRRWHLGCTICPSVASKAEFKCSQTGPKSSCVALNLIFSWCDGFNRIKN